MEVFLEKLKKYECATKIDMLLQDGIHYIKADESVESFGKAASLVKKSIKEFSEENQLSVEEDKDGLGQKTLTIWKYDPITVIFEKCINSFTIGWAQNYSVHFKQWRGVIFVLFWMFQEKNDETLERLEQTIEKMKVDFSANKKIEELNSNTLGTYLTAISNKHKIKYKIEKDNTFCSVMFYLKPYCRLKLKLCYSELSNQLESIEDIIQQTLLICEKSNLPQVTLTMGNMSATGIFR